MNFIHNLLYVLFTCSLLACSSTKAARNEKGKENEEGGAVSDPEPVKIVTKKDRKEKRSDPFQFQEVGVQDGVLQAIVRYSGGCEDHDFDLLAIPSKKESDPPRGSLFLEHESNGDACRSVIHDTLRFDLSPLNKPMILQLEGHQEDLRYGFE